MGMEHPVQSNSLVDVLETVLDKGLVVAGDIKVGLADVELLTIKIRLIVASVDKAKEIGMDWWETDPYLNSKAASQNQEELEKENQHLQKRIELLEKKVESGNRFLKDEGADKYDE